MRREVQSEVAKLIYLNLGSAQANEFFEAKLEHFVKDGVTEGDIKAARDEVFKEVKEFVTRRFILVVNQ